MQVWHGWHGHIPSEANTAGDSVLVAKDPCGAHLVRSEDGTQLMLVHGLREVGDVEIRIGVVSEGLELRVEGLLNKVSAEDHQHE